MSRRKLAALLAAFGLLVGLMQSGIGAQFTDQVIAQQDISVGTFSCKIVAATPVVGTLVAADGKSVKYTVPTIMSSASGSAPFTFTVQNTGSIDQQLTVSDVPVSSPWSIIGDPFSPIALNAGDSTTISTGISWDELGNGNLGQSFTETWTVNCGEVAPTTPLIHYAFNSTNQDNIDNTTPGRVGNGVGPNVTAVDNGSGSITLNFTAGSQTGYENCFEYVTDDNVPQQKLAENGGVNYNTGDVDTGVVVLDGLFPYVCVGDGQPATATVTLTGISNVQVRMVFGAEADYRFDWTLFTAS